VALQPESNMNRWVESMEAQMQAQRGRLQGRDPLEIAQISGAEWQPTGSDEGTLSLMLLQTPLVVHVPGYTVLAADGGEVPTLTQGLVTAYLLATSTAQRAGEWITFRELPNGLFYHQAFTGYTGDVLARTLGNDLDAFKRGAEAADGHVLTGFGDAAYEFRVLPRIWMAVAYWLGDDEDGVPPQATVLFDRAASSYLITDGLAIVASQLIRRIIARKR
jgi:hypothetical protein